MLKNFLKEYTEDRVETFSFVMLTIFTYGMYSLYWLGKINKNRFFKNHGNFSKIEFDFGGPWISVFDFS